MRTPGRCLLARDSLLRSSAACRRSELSGKLRERCHLDELVQERRATASRHGLLERLSPFVLDEQRGQRGAWRQRGAQLAECVGGNSLRAGAERALRRAPSRGGIEPEVEYR